MALRQKPSPLPYSALSALLLLAALFLFFQVQGARAPSPLRGTPSPTPGGTGIELYFTRPEAGGASVQTAGIETALSTSIESAERTVEVAAYHLDLPSIEEALIRTHRRGVTVRVVTESENVLEPAVTALQAAGIPVLGDRREGLMHHKFIVIDGRQVWTGSMNLTWNDLVRNDNNLIRVDSEQLAEDYRVEFDEMWADRFGADSIVNTPYPHLTVDGVPFEVYFAPDDGVAERVVRWVQSAAGRIEFLAFSFTSDEIAQAILDRAAAGVAVRGVMDASQAQGSGAEYGRLRLAGIEVRLDGNPGLMHHKVIVVDGQAVLTGSYNFSRSAEERNDENALLVFDPGVAFWFGQEFERVFELAR